MQPNTIVLVSNIDDHYAMPLTVTLRSAAENLSAGWSIRAFILEEGVTPRSKQLLETSLAGCAVTVQWCPSRLPENTFTLGSHPGGVPATYFKLMMGTALPADVTRAIYLDADTVVCADLLPLWQTDMQGHAVAAVADSRWQWERMNRLQMQEALFEQPGSYFNCGVMLIDLLRWRGLHMVERATFFADHYRRHLWLVDQDLINCVIDGDYHRLEPKWNLLDFYSDNYRHYWDMLRPESYSAAMLEQANKAPAVLHYSGIEKPWNGYGAAHDPEWFAHYYALTQWPVESDQAAAMTASAAALHQRALIAMVKSFYREMELGRVHGGILKDLARYLIRHPSAWPVLWRVMCRNAYWAIRACLAPRIHFLRGIRP